MKFGKPTRFKSNREKREMEHSVPRNRPVDQKTDQALRQALSSSTTLVEILPEADDSIKVYLDDERPCPAGWTLVKDHHEFFAFLDDLATREKITHLSLDWHLGYNKPDGVFVATQLAEKIFADPRYLPNLKRIGFHSSDREQAFRMKRVLSEINDVLSDDTYVRMRLVTSV